jgi:fructokinase
MTSNIEENQHDSPRIVLIGESLIDHFPEEKIIGGAPFNVARHIAALGAPPFFISRIGSDDEAKLIEGAMNALDMSMTGIQRDSSRATGRVDVTLVGHTHHFDIAAEQVWDYIDSSAAVESMDGIVPNMVCFGTLAQRSTVSRMAIHNLLQKAPNALKVLDLNLRDCTDNKTISEQSLRLTDVLKVNDDELHQLLEWFVADFNSQAVWGSEQYLTAVMSLIKRFALQNIIVTRGKDGYAAFDFVGRQIAQGKSPTIHVIDTVGAGDAFLAVTLLGVSLNWTLEISLLRACEFAAAICAVRGAFPADLQFYEFWKQRWGLEKRSTARSITAHSLDAKV